MNYYTRTRELAPPRQDRIIEQLWQLVELRRQLDIEYWFDRLARMWVLIHAPAAAALLLLVINHVVGSMRYGGF